MKSLSPFEITGLDALTEYSNLTEHDLLRASIAAINDSAMLTMMDRDGSILHANEKFCAHAGYSQKEIVGKRHDILHTKSAQKVKHYAMLEQLHRCGTWRGTLPLRHKNGTDIWTHTTVTPILNSTAEPDWYLCLHHDITDSKRTEQALMQIRLREAQMLKMGADWYWEIDRNFRFTTLSDGIRRVGEDPARYIGKCRWELSADGDDLKWKEHRATLLAHKPFTSFEYRIRSEAAPNQWKWFCTSGEPCFDEAGQFSGYRGLGRETTFQRNQQEAMWRLANVDSLTGLPNRLQFIEALHQAIRNPSHLTTALMLIDLDNFKSFNDSHGLQAGDSLLIALAQHLTDTLLPSDFVARIASDEFAVIRQGLKTVGELTDTLDVLIHSLQAERNQSELTKQSISIGVSLHPTDAKTAEDLLKDAQLALHVAKRNGGNQHVIFTQEHYRSAASQSELIEKMHQALDKGELVLHYQPIVDPRNRIIIGLEALLRWKSPQDGLLAPGAFWGSFDNMALASRIGQFVLREAIEQAGRWKRQQIPYGKVAVNVTSADFVAGGFTKSLKQLLDTRVRHQIEFSPFFDHLVSIKSNT